ncbi:MAG: alkaline phosphatase family protein [Chitinophagales bacterium]
MNMSDASKKQVIAIGIESADMYLIEKWCEEGKLPTLQKLKEKGTWRKLISTGDVASASSWPTLHTGTSPAKHGISRSHRHLKTGTYEIHKQYANAVHEEPCWIPLSRSGKRCAIIDVPKSMPEEGFNGIHFVNWGDEHQTWKQSSWPIDFTKEVIEKFGRHPLENWYMVRPQTQKEYSDLLENLLKGIHARNAMAKYVLEKERWDLFLISYSELHWVGHLYWHLMDETHPDYDVALAKVFGDAILQCYQAIDKGIEAMLPEDLENTTVMVFSNIGMGPNYSGRHLVGEVLKKLGMAGNVSSKQKKGVLSWLPAKKWGELALERAELVIPISLIKTVKKFIPEKLWDTWTRKFLYGGNNWKDSLAFSLPSDYSGAIRINLVGREPNGKIKEGKGYDEICAKIKSAFEALINPATGKKAVAEVIIVRDEHKGKYVNELPDIVITWSQDAPIKALSSPQIGTVSGVLIDKHTGGHQPYGFLILAGSNISTIGTLEEAHIMDIAPTILGLLGENIPQNMDGKLLPELKGLEVY